MGCRYIYIYIYIYIQREQIMVLSKIIFYLLQDGCSRSPKPDVWIGRRRLAYNDMRRAPKTAEGRHQLLKSCNSKQPRPGHGAVGDVLYYVRLYYIRFDYFKLCHITLIVLYILLYDTRHPQKAHWG